MTTRFLVTPVLSSVLEILMTLRRLSSVAPNL
jgi:hypothetical protein